VFRGCELRDALMGIWAVGYALIGVWTYGLWNVLSWAYGRMGCGICSYRRTDIWAVGCAFMGIWTYGLWNVLSWAYGRMGCGICSYRRMDIWAVGCALMGMWAARAHGYMLWDACMGEVRITAITLIGSLRECQGHPSRAAQRNAAGHGAPAYGVPHVASWCLMLPHGASWCLMVPHGASWCLMVPQRTHGGAGTMTGGGAGTMTDGGAGTMTDGGAGTTTDGGAGTMTDGGAGTMTDTQSCNLLPLSFCLAPHASCTSPPVLHGCSDAWLALLQLPVPGDLYHKVLLRLHSHVIPNMMAPNMLADFLTYSLNQGARVLVSFLGWRWTA